MSVVPKIVMPVLISIIRPPHQIIIFIAEIIESPFQATWKADEFNFWLIPIFLMGLVWGFLVVPVISYGEDYLFLKAMREDDIDIKGLFSGFLNQYVDIVLANLIAFALIAIGFVMLIIPGIIIAGRLVFIPYIVMDQKLEPMQAIEKSWKMTRGHGWKIFFMGIISFFLIIGGLICFIFGVFISIMWIHAAYASLYQAVLNQDLRASALINS